MPVLPSEEEAPEGITEQVAKDPTRTESTASSHESHNQGLATAQDHQSKGPQIPINMSDMPPAADKEETRQKAAQLNQE